MPRSTGQVSCGELVTQLMSTLPLVDSDCHLVTPDFGLITCVNKKLLVI